MEGGVPGLHGTEAWTLHLLIRPWLAIRSVIVTCHIQLPWIPDSSTALARIRDALDIHGMRDFL